MCVCQFFRWRTTHAPREYREGVLEVARGVFENVGVSTQDGIAQMFAGPIFIFYININGGQVHIMFVSIKYWGDFIFKFVEMYKGFSVNVRDGVRIYRF